MLQIRIGLWLAFLCCAGCGGDDAVAPIAGSKMMSELTTEEATALCNEHASDFDALNGVACTAQGLSKGQGEACVTERDLCQAEAPGGIDCDDVDTTALEGCDVDVETTESCVDEVGEFARGITCDKEPPSSFNPPPCFTELRANCPLFSR